MPQKRYQLMLALLVAMPLAAIAIRFLNDDRHLASAPSSLPSSPPPRAGDSRTFEPDVAVIDALRDVDEVAANMLPDARIDEGVVDPAALMSPELLRDRVALLSSLNDLDRRIAKAHQDIAALEDRVLQSRQVIEKSAMQRANPEMAEQLLRRRSQGSKKAKELMEMQLAILNSLRDLLSFHLPFASDSAQGTTDSMPLQEKQRSVELVAAVNRALAEKAEAVRTLAAEAYETMEKRSGSESGRY